MIVDLSNESLVLKRNANTIDQELVEAVSKGDRDAFERLYKRYFKKIVGFATRITGRSELAEDVAVDTMMVIWRKADSFSNRSRVSTWIFGIAYRIAMKAVTRNALETDSDIELEELPDSSTGMDELEQIFLRDQLGRAMQKLSVEQRSVMELTYYYGCTYTEISEILDCPVGTVKTRMRQARLNMKQFLSTATGRHRGM